MLYESKVFTIPQYWDQPEIDKFVKYIEDLKTENMYLVFQDNSGMYPFYEVNLTEIVGKLVKLWLVGTEMMALFTIFNTPKGELIKRLFSSNVPFGTKVVMSQSEKDPYRIHKFEVFPK